MHSRKLVLEGIFSLHRQPLTPRTLETFPHVTELTVRANLDAAADIAYLFYTLERLPMLETVSITFTRSAWFGRPTTITLPRVQEMSVFATKVDTLIPPILGYNKLPNLTSLHLQIPLLASGFPKPILPNTSFDEYLPNLTDLPELQAVMDRTSVTVTF